MVRISLLVFNRELIKWLGLGHDSFIECLAANARTRDGLKASTVIIDEYSQARNSANKSGADLKNVLTSSMGTRKEPLTVIITAASDVIDGPFKHELDGVMKVLRGTPRLDCAIAFDLSVHDDFSAVSYTVWSKDDKKFYTHTDYYFPKGALKGHPNEMIYRQWHEQGNLNFCKGDIIDMRQIASDIINNAKQLHVIRVGFDAYKSRELVNILSSAGFRGVLMPYSQTYGSFNLPVEAFELLAWGDPVGIVLNNNPINAYCLCNCVIDEDRLENKKPIKVSQFRKIDGAITLLMTLGLMSAYER